MANFNAPPIDPGSGTFGGRSAARPSSAAGAAHGSPRSYLIGFVLSVILTVIPFAMVMQPGLSHATVVAGVLTMAVVQIFVHLVFFLHMNTSSEQRWNVFAFAFTVLITVIMVSGSVWIMNHLVSNMSHRMDNEAVVPQ